MDINKFLYKMRINFEYYSDFKIKIVPIYNRKHARTFKSDEGIKLGKWYYNR